MWLLDRPSQNILDEYVALFLDKINKQILKYRTYARENAWGNHLLPLIDTEKYDEQIIREILISEPQKLYDLNKKYLGGIIKEDAITKAVLGADYVYSEDDIDKYVSGKRKKEKNRSEEEKKLILVFDDLFQYLFKVFNYDWFQGAISYRVAEMKKTNTCPYCNRTYTFTIGKVNENGELTSKIRPQFDHWFAHSYFPLLSISFYNLIPSCSVCNSSVKGTSPFKLNTHIHPYTTPDCNPAFRFYPSLVTKDNEREYRWTVILKRKPDSKEDKTIQDLLLEQIYDKHGELEVKDIMDFSQKYNPTYLKNLFKKLTAELEGEYSVEDVYRMLFGIEAEMDKTLERPFSKLKRDILEYVGIKLC